MNCAAIMTRAPLTIREDENVANATSQLIAHGSLNVPVVDGEGRYTGMFGVHDLLSLLVPRVALAGNLTSNLRFISDDPDELRRRFRDVKSRRVCDIADRNYATLAPELVGDRGDASFLPRCHFAPGRRKEIGQIGRGGILFECGSGHCGVANLNGSGREQLC